MGEAAEKNKFVPLFSGTDPKSVMKGQRQYCLSELGAGAKLLAENEAQLERLTKQYQEVDDTLDKIEENYRALRSPETPVVKLDEFQYVRTQYRDFTAKAEELEGQVSQQEKVVKKIREQCETMRANVIFLDERLSQEAEVIPLHGSARRRIEG